MAKYGISDLVMTSGLPYTRTFTYRMDDTFVDWREFEVHLQMRDRVRGSLLIELTAFLEVDPDDPTKLVMDVDASFTPHLAKEGKWDILALPLPGHDVVGFRTPRPVGRILVLQGATSV